MNLIIKASLSNFIKNKGNLFSVLLIGFLLALSLLISSFYSTMDKFINNGIKQNSAFKILLVKKNTENNDSIIENDIIREEIEKIENVDGVFSVTSKYNALISPTFKNNKMVSGIVELNAANEKTLPKIVKGNGLVGNNSMVCPKNFYPGDVYSKISRFDFIDIEKYIGKNIDFEVENYSSGEKKIITYKLSGIYENSKSETDEFICYVNEQSLYDIFVYQRTNDNFVEIENQNGYYVQVNSVDNVKSVENELKKMNYGVAQLAFVDYSIFENIYNKMNKASLIYFVLILLLLVFIQTRNIIFNNKQCIIMRCLGIKFFLINIFSLFNNFFFYVLSSLSTIIFSLVVKYFLKILIYYKPLLFDKKEIVFDYSALLKMLLISFFVSIISSIINGFYIRKRMYDK